MTTRARSQWQSRSNARRAGIRPSKEASAEGWDRAGVAMDDNSALADLIDHWSDAARAYLAGDLRAYAGLANHARDYTLIPPQGGDPRRGFDSSEDAADWTARTFRGGDVDFEVFETYASGDLAVL